MRNIRNVLSLLLVLLSLSACEEEIKLDFESSNNRITITALASPDTTLLAFVTEARELDYFSTILLRSNYYDYDVVKSTMKHMYLDTALVNASLKEADVRVQVNGDKSYPMNYDEVHCCYTSDYTPQHGDLIRIDVDSKSNGNPAKQLTHVTASTTIPSEPKIEIVSTEVKYKKKESYIVEDYYQEIAIDDYYGSDTVMVLKLKIHDPGKEKNFYRLKIRSVGGARKYAGAMSARIVHIAVDYFSSDDKLFYDSDLVKGYGFLPAYFSNVFDDGMINGKEYEFTVESRMRSESEITPYVIVELQQLSPDLYYYLKNIEEFRISDFDLYNNPIGIHSNVGGGWGVLGSMNFDTHIVPFENMMYE